MYDQLAKNLKRLCSNGSRQDKFWQDFERLEKMAKDDFSSLFSATQKRLGRETHELELTTLHFQLSELNIGQTGRFLLCLNCPDENWLLDILYRGNDAEKQIILLALPYLKDPSLFHELAVDSCRTHSSEVYSTLCDSSPYPRDFFSDEEFRQFAIKTIFMELPFNKIVGLQDRFHPEMGQSLIDLLEEKTSAGRKMPDDVLQFMKENK